jgi:hypothetical protein
MSTITDLANVVLHFAAQHWISLILIFVAPFAFICYRAIAIWAKSKIHGDNETEVVEFLAGEHFSQKASAPVFHAFCKFWNKVPEYLLSQGWDLDEGWRYAMLVFVSSCAIAGYIASVFIFSSIICILFLADPILLYLPERTRIR